VNETRADTEFYAFGFGLDPRQEIKSDRFYLMLNLAGIKNVTSLSCGKFSIFSLTVT